jgi:hypothetical protein
MELQPKPLKHRGTEATEVIGVARWGRNISAVEISVKLKLNIPRTDASSFPSHNYPSISSRPVEVSGTPPNPKILCCLCSSVFQRLSQTGR